jgi:hypothetical protein
VAVNVSGCTGVEYREWAVIRQQSQTKQCPEPDGGGPQYLDAPGTRSQNDGQTRPETFTANEKTEEN